MFAIAPSTRHQAKKWHENGRIWAAATDPSREVWTTSMDDDTNVYLGDGIWAPYVWDGVNNVAQFGNSEIDLSAGGMLKFLGIEKINRMDYVLEGDFGAGFVEANVGIPAITAVENDDHLLINLDFPTEFRWQDVPGRTAQDGDMPVQWRTQLKVESGNNLRIGQYITSPMAHDIRVRFENAGMDPFDGVQDKRDVIRPRKVSRDSDEVLVNTVAGTEIGGMRIIWSDPESDLRTINVTVQGNKRTLEVFMGPYTLVADQELVIFPDTWSPGEIDTADNDYQDTDGTSGKSNHDGDGLQVGFNGGTYTSGFRWTGIPTGLATASSISTDTYITYDVTWTDSSGTNTVKGVEEDNPTIWGSTKFPSNTTQTAASATVIWGSTGLDQQTPDLGAVFEEVRSTVTWSSGGALACVWAGVTGVRYQVQAYENIGGGINACRLTINYLLAADNPVLVFSDFQLFADA